VKSKIGLKIPPKISKMKHIAVQNGDESTQICCELPKFVTNSILVQKL
jgi:hypothetical protein